MARVSLCMIARDEEASIARALRSAAAAVDELCVLDTGSRDRTSEVAAGCGARVERFAWRDDFAAARNASLAMARGDWILVLDADEVLAGPPDAPDPRAALDAFCARAAGCAGTVELVNRGAAGEQGRLVLTRLLPADGRHRYAGRVHEQVVVCDDAGARPPRRAPTGLAVVHDGYTPGALATKGKLARNARLLALELGRAPRDGYLWFQLGRTRALAGDAAGALHAYERALAGGAAAAPWRIQACEGAAYALRGLGRSAQALELLEREPAPAARPDRLFLRALLAMDLARVGEAEQGFRRCLELGPAPAGAAESDPAAATSAPAHNLGVLHELQGRPAEARAFYLLAQGFEPGHGPSRAGLARLDAARYPSSTLLATLPAPATGAAP